MIYYVLFPHCVKAIPGYVCLIVTPKYLYYDLKESFMQYGLLQVYSLAVFNYLFTVNLETVINYKALITQSTKWCREEAIWKTNCTSLHNMKAINDKSWAFWFKSTKNSYFVQIRWINISPKRLASSKFLTWPCKQCKWAYGMGSIKHSQSSDRGQLWIRTGHINHKYITYSKYIPKGEKNRALTFEFIFNWFNLSNPEKIISNLFYEEFCKCHCCLWTLSWLFRSSSDCVNSVRAEACVEWIIFDLIREGWALIWNHPASRWLPLSAVNFSGYSMHSMIS